MNYGDIKNKRIFLNNIIIEFMKTDNIKMLQNLKKINAVTIMENKKKKKI